MLKATLWTQGVVVGRVEVLPTTIDLGRQQSCEIRSYGQGLDLLGNLQTKTNANDEKSIL